jgi:hypothetical protein
MSSDGFVKKALSQNEWVILLTTKVTKSRRFMVIGKFFKKEEHDPELDSG